MGNCCCRNNSALNDGRKKVDVTGRFSYIDEAATKHGDDSGEYACIDDVVPKPRNAVCSAEDVRAFFAVEPKETYDDECEGPRNNVTAGVGTTVNTFRLHAEKPRDAGCKLSNGTTSKTTTVLVKLNAHHRTTPEGCANDAFSGDDQSESEMNIGGITKTSFFTFTADSDLAKEAISIRNASSSRRAESQKCDPNTVPVAMSQNKDTTTGDRQENVASSASTIMEVNRGEQKSSHETHDLLRNEDPQCFPPTPVEKLSDGNYENNQMESNVILHNSRSYTDTNRDGIKIKTKCFSPSIISHKEDDASIVGLEQIGITYRGEPEDDASLLLRILDCDKDLYPMYDSDFASSDYAEADRDLNEIWTVSEFLPFLFVEFCLICSIA